MADGRRAFAGLARPSFGGFLRHHVRDKYFYASNEMIMPACGSMQLIYAHEADFDTFLKWHALSQCWRDISASSY